jgi:phosphoglycolate phosphatase-like HAD superfamily hydrolase
MTQVAGIHGQFATLVFDCDGVILDSNRIKTEAFRRVALRYGSDAAEELVRFHVQNGGISRYRKFEHLLIHILGRRADEASVRTLTDAYGECVYRELLQCAVAPGLHDLRQSTEGQAWMVVSGGDEQELRGVFAARGLDMYFDRGVYGSPATKDAILQREKLSGNLALPALFAGDSRYDHEAAVRAGLQFVFVRGWSEFGDWDAYCKAHQLPIVDSIGDLLPTWQAEFRTASTSSGSCD